MFFVSGLGYGDEGKGTIVDFLASKTNSNDIVRYNGGPQAGHNVVHSGHHHCFSQIGSSLKEGVKTYLSEYMLVDPFALDAEREVFEHKTNIYIDGNCVIITPMQKLVGRINELYIKKGSCGMGVGETSKDSKYLSLRANELQDKTKLREKLSFMLKFKLDHAEQIIEHNGINKETRILYNMLKSIEIKDLTNMYYNLDLNIVSNYDISPDAIFEGSQGVLLDVKHGFSPFITKRDITFNNADKLTKHKTTRLGVIRAYSTRHGEGPFVTEDTTLNVPDVHNVDNEWQGKFRVGWLDIIATKYAIESIGGIDNIALTNLDRLPKFKACTSYEYTGKKNVDDTFEHDGKNIYRIKTPSSQQLTKCLFECKPVYTEFKDEEQYLSFIESELGPISIISRGPERSNKILVDELS